MSYAVFYGIFFCNWVLLKDDAFLTLYFESLQSVALSISLSMMMWRCRVRDIFPSCVRFVFKISFVNYQTYFFLLRDFWDVRKMYIFETLRIVSHHKNKIMINIVRSTNWVVSNHYVIAIIHWSDHLLILRRTLVFHVSVFFLLEH